jgi:hypothetical protein
MLAGSPPHPSNLAAGDRLACRRAATHPWLSPSGWHPLRRHRWRRWSRPASCWWSRSTIRCRVRSTRRSPTSAGRACSRSSRRARVAPSRPLAAPGDPRPSRRCVSRRLTAAPRRTTVAPAWSWPCSGARRARSRSRAAGRPSTSTRRDPRAGPCCPRARLAASAPEALDRPQAAPRQAGPGQARRQTGPAPPGGPGRRAGWRVALPRPPARGRGTGSAGSGTASPGPRHAPAPLGRGPAPLGRGAAVPGRGPAAPGRGRAPDRRGPATGRRPGPAPRRQVTRRLR